MQKQERMGKEARKEARTEAKKAKMEAKEEAKMEAKMEAKKEANAKLQERIKVNHETFTIVFYLCGSRNASKMSFSAVRPKMARLSALLRRSVGGS
jgi:sorbitol-specific phosphotransferase system component IIBC